VNKTLNITSAGKSLAQTIFKPVPLHSVYSVHNRETLDVPDVYKCQLPGIREYFGEDIAFYFSFMNFYNQYLVYIAIIGIIAYIFEFISYQNDDNASSNGAFILSLSLSPSLSVCVYSHNISHLPPNIM